MVVVVVVVAAAVAVTDRRAFKLQASSRTEGNEARKPRALNRTRLGTP